jgi:hypothetical protein
MMGLELTGRKRRIVPNRQFLTQMSFIAPPRNGHD